MKGELFLSSFGDRLKVRREDLGITQTALAKQLGVARPTLANFEAGRRSPDLLMVFHVAHYLRTTVTALLGEGLQLRVEDSERALDEAMDVALFEFRMQLKQELRRTVQRP